MGVMLLCSVGLGQDETKQANSLRTKRIVSLSHASCNGQSQTNFMSCCVDGHCDLMFLQRTTCTFGPSTTAAARSSAAVGHPVMQKEWKPEVGGSSAAGKQEQQQKQPQLRLGASEQL
jgi:hypothetical protein